jgi:hypothetical protein
MGMSEFQFQKSQRVIVPAQAAGADNVQGVVVGIFDRIGREPSYALQWMCTDKADEAGQMMTLGQAFDESRLLEAQPKEANGLTVEVKVDQTDLDSALGKARELEGIVRRTSKRKPSRKRTRK